MWIVKNGELVTQLTGDDFGEYVDLGQSDMLLSRNEGVSNIIIDGDTYMRAWDGVNIVVYDNLQGEVVDAIGFMMVNPNAVIR